MTNTIIPSFRVKTLVDQIKFNASECSNPSIKKLLNITAGQINNTNKTCEIEYTMAIIEENLRFFKNLSDIMEEGQAKNIVKYTISLLDQKDFFLGNDNLDEPQD